MFALRKVIHIPAFCGRISKERNILHPRGKDKREG